MPSYSGIEKDMNEGFFQILHTKIREYNNYIVYVDEVWLDDYVPSISDFSPDELVIRNQNEKEIEFDELPKDIRNDITKEII